ncbi:MAG TPA: LuxR C-terminal-related transcriptional regulator [Myxococcota bacterium]|nr:LuxR C-terminal-related transcriptional regulator [Myxococcota bacterium]HNH48295.1 LuxR C-terminal-related transcriptional regulator [Myxococcota bacterium]
MSASILLTDAHGRLKAANENARELLGLPESLQGLHCRDVIHAKDETGFSPCDLCRHEQLGACDQRDHSHLQVQGQAVDMICSGLGDQRVIALLPLDSPPQGANLTQREREVLVLVARGLTTAKIAERLKLGYPTVRTHMEHIREKLGVKTRAQAVARALALRLIE